MRPDPESGRDFSREQGNNSQYALISGLLPKIGFIQLQTAHLLRLLDSNVENNKVHGEPTIWPNQIIAMLS